MSNRSNPKESRGQEIAQAQQMEAEQEVPQPEMDAVDAMNQKRPSSVNPQLAHQKQRVDQPIADPERAKQIRGDRESLDPGTRL